MNVKDKIQRAIQNAIETYDFEDAISDAFDEIDVQGMIEDQIEKRIRRIDVEPLLTDLIESYISDQLDDMSLEDDILEALQNTFEDM